MKPIHKFTCLAALAQDAAAIYTGGMHGGWAVMRRIGIRSYSWLNWLYPVPF